DITRRSRLWRDEEQRAAEERELEESTAPYRGEDCARCGSEARRRARAVTGQGGFHAGAHPGTYQIGDVQARSRIDTSSGPPGLQSGTSCSQSFGLLILSS